ncbi:hypothetical protein LFL96_23905 [Paraburkholderia sp. D15]|uniref:hypothetical protein n=1 Tax=Paraburkholderia sp. D15 TaxID=2880218 RepID=UPI002479C87E|nr:hypothetical protein [Paraburkholderia sp. D15]WGS54082.1 hypothetical protein LFL96_23905 [Paraburkholderia sp. D15]
MANPPMQKRNATLMPRMREVRAAMRGAKAGVKEVVRGSSGESVFFVILVMPRLIRDGEL